MPTIQGKIIQAFTPRTGRNDRGDWAVQEFLLESYDQPYTRKCIFSVFGNDRLQQFNIKEGDDVAVDVDIDAREYNGRYYNSVRAWRVAHIQGPQLQGVQGAMAMPPVGQPQVGVPLPPPTAGNMVPPSDPLAGDPLGGDATEDLPF